MDVSLWSDDDTSFMNEAHVTQEFTPPATSQSALTKSSQDGKKAVAASKASWLVASDQQDVPLVFDADNRMEDSAAVQESSLPSRMGTIRFFWLDAYEDARTQPGVYARSYYLSQ